jgi:hypothetical protein
MRGNLIIASLIWGLNMLREAFDVLERAERGDFLLLEGTNIL